MHTLKATVGYLRGGMLSIANVVLRTAVIASGAQDARVRGQWATGTASESPLSTRTGLLHDVAVSTALRTSAASVPPTLTQQLTKVTLVTPSDDLPGLLANASDGDVFELADGSYEYKCRSSGMLELTAGSLTVRARNAGRALIDGQQCAKRVLYVAAAGSRLVLDGLNVTGGREGDGAGGGMFIGGSSQVTVSNSRIYSNGARQAGAGIYIEGSAQVNITSTSIYSNTAEGTGGGGVAILGGNVSFDSCNIHDNQAYYGTYLPGAGVYISGSAHVIIANTGIYYNTASGGGGVAIDSGTLSFIRCDIYDNQATKAGGVYNRDGAIATDNFTAIHHNIPTDCDGDPSWTQPACGRQPTRSIALAESTT